MSASTASVVRRELEAAAALFGDDSYWRDLVSFTWHIKRAEGPCDIRAMLEATMPAGTGAPPRSGATCPGA